MFCFIMVNKRKEIEIDNFVCFLFIGIVLIIVVFLLGGVFFFVSLFFVGFSIFVVLVIYSFFIV